MESFVSKVNGAMRKLHEQEKVRALADRITDNYNVVEAVNEEMERVKRDGYQLKWVTTQAPHSTT